jgi:hypothetical protein
LYSIAVAFWGEKARFSLYFAAGGMRPQLLKIGLAAVPVHPFAQIACGT